MFLLTLTTITSSKYKLKGEITRIWQNVRLLICLSVRYIDITECWVVLSRTSNSCCHSSTCHTNLNPFLSTRQKYNIQKKKITTLRRICSTWHWKKGFDAVLKRHLILLSCKEHSLATLLQAQLKLVFIHSANNCTRAVETYPSLENSDIELTLSCFLRGLHMCALMSVELLLVVRSCEKPTLVLTNL